MPRGTRKPAKSFFERDFFWSLNLDFLAPMRLQMRVNDGQKLYYFKGKTTETVETEKREPLETELGGKIGVKDSTGRATVVEYGSKNPGHETRFSQKEIFEDVLDNTETEDVITKTRGLVHDIPKPVEGLDTIQGAEELWEEQQAYSNKAKQWRRATGLPLRSWYPLIKNKLLERGIIDKDDVQDWFSTSIRSSLNMEFILPSNLQGYDILKNRGELLPIQKALVQGNFWEDTGLPVETVIDHRRQRARGWTYELDKEGILIGF